MKLTSAVVDEEEDPVTVSIPGHRPVRELKEKIKKERWYTCPVHQIRLYTTLQDDKWLTKDDPSFQQHPECRRINRSDGKTAVPIVLLNETFARFEANCKSIDLTTADCGFAIKLCKTLSSPFKSRVMFAKAAQGLLRDYLLADLGQACHEAPLQRLQINGGVTDGSYRCDSLPLLNLHCTLQKGDGGGDSTMKNVAFYLNLLPDKIQCQVPCLLVDVCGPLLSVFGIVNTSAKNVLCEPVGVSVPLLNFQNEWLMVSVARTCASLKVAVKELTVSCRERVANANPRVLEVDPHLGRLGFPYKESIVIGGETVSYRYLQQLHRCVFVAINKETSVQVIIKLTTRYGKNVHEHCANAGFAPKLLHCEMLLNGWIFVVMEKLSHVPLVQADPKHRVTIQHQLTQIKISLREAGFVHGDMRETNVLWDVDGNRVVLIDFALAGVNDVGVYPPFMNSEVAWPLGVGCGKRLRVDHDAYWLDELMKRFGGVA
ncbi:hypothetical protein Poli38472_000860 [Pythium oligandrum]|uniref:Protein kinase domain-containing protein n=1 Tax=Pythium oligandrum TaxID=41045 RepID=A0A8K1CDY3_PYTOL|nr:hypothetical protein Poli38472_000860 [Pythium oligandrum]|eukprot:TMW60818.1 hypothetical protein Poli38472_000860 [Pythium oligandrum]